eukprot:1141943-Pelagomonas_calceolata.AAC.2
MVCNIWWNLIKVWLEAVFNEVLLASSLLNPPCLSRLERAGPPWLGGNWACFAGLQILACAGGINLKQLFFGINNSIEFFFTAEASTGRASPGFSYVDLFARQCSNQVLPGISSGWVKGMEGVPFWLMAAVCLWPGPVQSVCVCWEARIQGALCVGQAD